MNPSMMIILLSPRQRTTSTMATPADATRDEMTTSPSSPRGVGEYESTPRLLITKMELENFKSYAGVREIGPFHKCFSAVVGPNGSGKSNVIDAMLFVFGKRAKQLRLNKVSELIHKSDAVKNNPPTFARVSVFLQDIVDTGPGDEDYRLIPGTECVISRVARDDNSSTYKINGKNAQFKEVAALLGSKGVDLDNNRFLILQGEVEMISMMPPKGKTENDEGLLEYLEDIIGSSKFVEETNLASEKVEQLTEVRQEKLNRVKAVEKEKDSLQSAKLEAEALLGKEREIRRKQNILFQIHAAKAQKEIDFFKEKSQKVQEKLEVERQKMAEANERVREIEEALVERRKNYDIIYDELTKTKEEFSAYERRDIKLREDIKYNKAQKQKLENKVKSEQKKLDGAISKSEQAKENIPKLEAEIVSLNEQKVVEEAKADEMYEQNKEELNKLRADLQKKTQELAPVQQERTVFQAELDTAETELKLLEESSTQAKQKLEAAEEELSTLDETKDSKRQELSSCEDELRQAKDRVVEATNEDAVLAEKELMLAKRSKDLLARSEEAKAALQSKGGGSKSPAIQGILKAAAKGGELSKVGILGRLGDLATIPEEYDVAVSTACSMLDHIVVQTTAGAQKCLEFLRKHGLGRANFIPLDKMKKGAHDRVVETPEGAPRLFELITPLNFAVSPAIFLGVADTLVAPDLETASRWAYEYNKRWRVVTVDGKLIETAGTMSGGGNSVRRGAMKLSNGKKSAPVEHDDDLTDSQNLEEEASKAQELLVEVRKRRKELAAEIKDLNKSIKSLEKKIPKISIELDGFETTRENLTASIPELRKKSAMSKSDEKKVSELRQKISKCKSDMASCSMQASKLEADVARLQKSILDVGGPKYKKQKERCEKIISDLEAAEKGLNSAKVTVSSSDKTIGKATEARDRAEEEFKECIRVLEEKQHEFKSLEEDAFKVMQAYERVKEIEQEKREALDLFSKEVEDLKNSQSGAKVVEIELAGQLDAHNKQILESEKKKYHWEEEVQKLVDMAEQYDEFDESDDEDEGDETMENKEDNEGTSQVERSSSKSALPVLSLATLEKYDAGAVKEDISILEAERNTIAKNANMGAIAEYRKKEADYLSKVEELDAVTEERNNVRRTFEDLRRKRLEMFMDGFGQITLKLKEMYQMITLGGDAELELVDSLDPFSEGIVFSVRPPKKSWKNISNLSGGEKTLSSLALVFALHHFKPTPLYVMDEIDAALDFKNVSIVANYIKERTKNAQFIIISLRNNMFELADRLVGIYKTNNCTKSVTINPRAFGVESVQNGASRSLAPSSALKERPSNRREDVSQPSEGSDKGVVGDVRNSRRVAMEDSSS